MYCAYFRIVLPMELMLITIDNIYNIAKINDIVKFLESPAIAKVPKHVDSPYKKINSRLILNKDSIC